MIHYFEQSVNKTLNTSVVPFCLDSNSCLGCGNETDRYHARTCLHSLSTRLSRISVVMEKYPYHIN